MRNCFALRITAVALFLLAACAQAHAEIPYAYYRAPGTRADYWYPGYRDGFRTNYPYRPGFSIYRGPQFRYGGPYLYGYTSPYYDGDAGLAAKRTLEYDKRRAAAAAEAAAEEAKK